MSDEYSVHTNFQRASDDSRARGEYEYRMGRVRNREAEMTAARAEAAIEDFKDGRITGEQLRSYLWRISE